MAVCVAAGVACAAAVLGGPDSGGGLGAQRREAIVVERRGLDEPRRRFRGGEWPGLRDAVIRQVNVDGAGLNIAGDAANETSLAIDPRAPRRMAVAWRQFDTIASSTRQAGYAFTRDGGRTWTTRTLDPGVIRTDPVLRFDADGMLFWNSLFVGPGDSYRCDVFRSYNAGLSWGPPVPAYGGDKPWMAIDRVSPAGLGRGNIYQAWNVTDNPTPGMTFNRSIDHASTWSVPRPLPSQPCFGQIAIGPSGEVYVAGQVNATVTGTFLVTRSLDARTGTPMPAFGPAVTVNMGGLSYVDPGPGFPNPEGLQGQVNLCVDTSSGPQRGWVYMLATARVPGGDPMDVLFTRSTDGGASWSPAVRVNGDTLQAGAWQWFGTMSIAPSGRLDVVWVDTRESLQANLGRLYYRSSADGGTTWSSEQAIGPVWDSWAGWPAQNKIGDYYDMESDDVGASLAFAATYNGEQDVYYTRIGGEDCNRNGVPDSVDIATGVETDCNGNGVPDSCEIAAGTLVRGDFDGDGATTPADVAAYINAWAHDLTAGTLVADVDKDGTVTPADVAMYIAAWSARVAGGACG